jgi:hypothetical protein
VIAGTDPVELDIFSAVARLQELVESHDYDGLTEYIAEIIPAFAAERASQAA